MNWTEALRRRWRGLHRLLRRCWKAAAVVSEWSVDFCFVALICGISSASDPPPIELWWPHRLIPPRSLLRQLPVNQTVQFELIPFHRLIIPVRCFPIEGHARDSCGILEGFLSWLRATEISSAGCHEFLFSKCSDNSTIYFASFPPLPGVWVCHSVCISVSNYFQFGFQLVAINFDYWINWMTGFTLFNRSIHPSKDPSDELSHQSGHESFIIPTGRDRDPIYRDSYSLPIWSATRFCPINVSRWQFFFFWHLSHLIKSWNFF